MGKLRNTSITLRRNRKSCQNYKAELCSRACHSEFSAEFTTSREMESGTRNHPTMRSSAPDGFRGEFYLTFRQELAPILLKL